MNAEDEIRAQLFKRMCDGDNNAGRTLLASFHPDLWPIAKAILDNEHDAHDCIQATWEKAYQHRASFNPSKSITGWVKTICRNVAVSKLKKTKPLLSLSAVEEPAVNDIAKEQKRVELVALHACLQELPEEIRFIVDMRTKSQGNVSFNTIATAMYAKESTIRDKFNRSLIVLKDCIERRLANVAQRGDVIPHPIPIPETS